MSSSSSMPMWQAVMGLIVAGFMMSSYAVTIDTVRKLKNGETVPASSTNFLYTMTTGHLIVSIVALIFFAFTLFKQVRGY